MARGLDLLLESFPPGLQVMEHYCIAEYADVEEFLSHLARKTGKLKKGLVVNSQCTPHCQFYVAHP